MFIQPSLVQLGEYKQKSSLRAIRFAIRGVKTSGSMAPELDLSKQRPAQYVFSSEVQKRLSDIRKEEAVAAAEKAAAKAAKAEAAASASTAA